VQRGVVPELLRQVVPLATGPEAVDDAVQRPPGINTGPPPAAWRVQFFQYLFYFSPQLIRDFPDRVKMVLLIHKRPPSLESTLRYSFAADNEIPVPDVMVRR
jgi:hypothetical protein